MGACSVLKSISEWEKVTPATGRRAQDRPPTWGGYDPSFSAAGQDTLSVFGEKAFPLPLDPSVFCSDAPVQDGQ